MLQQVLENQKKILAELRTVRESQSVLSHSQNALVHNQQLLVDKLEKCKASAVSKAEFTAQAKILTEIKTSLEKLEETAGRTNCETCNNALEEIGKMLPLMTTAAVQEMEQKLESYEFVQLMKTHIHKVKGPAEDVGLVIRAIFTDDLMAFYNWDGRWEKLALRKLLIVDQVLRDVFHQQSSFEFEKSVKKAVERSHHRVKQKNYVKKVK